MSWYAGLDDKAFREMADNYSAYVMDALERGIEPVCMHEFYINEWCDESEYLVRECSNLILNNEDEYRLVIVEAIEHYLDSWGHDGMRAFLGIDD